MLKNEMPQSEKTKKGAEKQETNSKMMSKDEMMSKAQPTEIAQDNAFWNPQRVRLLGGSIIIMSFLLILGFALVVYKLIEKALVNQPQTINLSKNDTIKLQSTTLKPAFELDLNGYEIKQMSSSGKLLTLHVVRGNEAQLWIIDSTAKKIKKIIQLNK